MTESLSSASRRLLFVRLDRIGDLVLTLPVDQALEGDAVHWWVPQGLRFVTDSAAPVRSSTEIPKAIDFARFLSLLRDLKNARFDGAIVFHAPWWMSLLLWLARIPVRGGVKSQWHSFLFLNRAVRQKRSRAEASELEYNFRLVEAVLGLAPNTLRRGALKLRGLAEPERTRLLAAHGLEPLAYSVVHPGMGGSALNWPTVRYQELIEELARTEPVAITGTKADEPYLAPLKTALNNNARIIWLDSKLSGPELLTVLAAARTITAPSTGVLHLAASTDRPTLGIFSPVRVQHPKRWGPHGKRAETLMPKLDCPGGLSCLGPTCPHYECMPTVSAEDALAALKRMESR